MNQHHNSRRDFLKNAGLLGAAAAFPNILSKLPGEKVNLACIGLGNQGGLDVMSLYNTGLANIVALCDVDMGAPQTLKVLEKFPDVPRFQDFRQMFDKMGSQIEAVSIGVPDFSCVAG